VTAETQPLSFVCARWKFSVNSNSADKIKYDTLVSSFMNSWSWTEAP